MAKTATAIVMCVLVASFVAFTPRAADTQQRSPAKITWDLVQTLGLDHPITLKHKEFAQMVYERTNGRMEIILRGPGELPYRGSEALRIVGRGQVAAAEAITVFVQAEAPMLGITELPFLIRNWDEAWKVRKLVDKYYAEAFDRFGVVPIVYCIYGPTNTWTKVPIKSMDEIKGMKIRATTAEIGDITKAYGGTPITLLTVDTYQALKTGVADGFIGNTVTSFGQKWYEATPYVLRNAVGFVSQQIVVNKKALESLPEDIRSIVLKAARETEVNLEAMLRKADRGLEQKLVEQGSLKGITIPTPEESAKNRAMASPVWRAWATRNGPVAVQALETLLKDMDR